MTTRISRARCDYKILGTEDGIIFLRDLNLGRMSVTNDAEAVVERIKFIYGQDARVVYQDSDGKWSEIVWDTKIERTARFLPWYGLDWDILSRKDNDV